MKQINNKLRNQWSTIKKQQKNKKMTFIIQQIQNTIQQKKS